MSKFSGGRPRIGVTGPDEGGWPSWICIRLLLWLSGAQAVRLTPKRRRPREPWHALVIGGGADIHPSRYNEEILATIKTESKRVHRRWAQFTMSVILWLLRRVFSVVSTSRRQDIARDALEFVLLREAVEARMPVLGICRGGQLINVYFGGSLHQDISGFYVEKPNLRTLRPRKLVQIESGTTLARLLENRCTFVNSLHNQSVNVLGKGLRVSAREMNGVVQAIEHTDLPFVLGVQWHPEFLPLVRAQRRIFHFLTEAARVHQLTSQTGSLPPDLEIWNLAKS
ncbi:MAG: gamma-glutamyl-gamma-aminobutyrate hydrolase family protein [Bdellovibrionales bacterium]|nr:gamma-glutamyl-gamma-aminobutyrate hydrolase family protein [Bdellovibrionales bacterium]